MQNQIIKDEAAKLSIQISDDMLEKFNIYSDTLIEWNSKMNLTTITDPVEIAIKHFIDSLEILKYVQIPKGASLIDVGTGAGFPGLPLKIVREDIKLTLLDSLNKRLTFLNTVCHEIDVDAQTVHMRAEEGGKTKNLREQFDIAVARAVAPMNVLCEYCLPYVKKDGIFVAMKGPSGFDELEQAKGAISKLGGEIEDTFSFDLADNSKRALMVIRKVSNTDLCFPRLSAKIAKSPLK